MNIGTAASASGVSAKMIRYYEDIGLIGRATRQANGYRHYGDVDVHTLRFVHRARRLGFPLEQIRKLVGLWRNPRRSSHDVKRIALAHVADLELKVAELQSMVSVLRHLAGHCHGDARPECPILDDLAETADTQGTRQVAHDRRRSTNAKDRPKRGRSRTGENP